LQLAADSITAECEGGLLYNDSRMALYSPLPVNVISGKDQAWGFAGPTATGQQQMSLRK